MKHIIFSTLLIWNTRKWSVLKNCVFVEKIDYKYSKNFKIEYVSNAKTRNQTDY